MTWSPVRLPRGNRPSVSCVFFGQWWSLSLITGEVPCVVSYWLSKTGLTYHSRDRAGMNLLESFLKKNQDAVLQPEYIPLLGVWCVFWFWRLKGYINIGWLHRIYKAYCLICLSIAGNSSSLDGVMSLERW